MLLQVLGGIATLITTIFAALGLALGVPAEASSSETSSLGSSELGTLTNPALTSLPASARVATPEEVDEILATEWETPHTPVVFREASENFRSKPEATHTAIFRVCNRNWVDLVVDRETAQYRVTNHTSTLAGCSAFFRLLGLRDSAYSNAISQGNTFYVEDEDTIYLAGPEGALKLTRSKVPAAPIQPPAEPPTDLPENVLEPLPATARKATPEELKHILTQTWKSGYSTLEFSEWDQTHPPQHPGTTHLSQLRVCNYQITELQVDVETASVTRHGGRVTDAGCEQWRHDLDDTYRKAVSTTDTFYVEGADTIYLAGPEGALKLTRADQG